MGLAYLTADLQGVVHRSPLVCGLGPWHCHSVSHAAGRSGPLLAKAVLCILYASPMAYPVWSYFPRNTRPPSWAVSLVEVVQKAEAKISTVDRKTGLSSDAVLSELSPGLQALDYVVESGKTQAAKIRRPVLFGENGHPEVNYEIDAFHDQLGIAVEVEAGRGAAGNADYRDIVRTSLILDARNMALLMPVRYRTASGERTFAIHAYEKTRNQLDAIFASRRLKLPFEGVLLVGY
jgi:hypothetical protein